MSMRTIDPEQYKSLRREFEAIKPKLLDIGRQTDDKGAWARAMLVMIPALLHLIERERKIQVLSVDVFCGFSSLLCDMVLHIIRMTAGPAERARFFNLLMRELETKVRPRLERTEGGLYLPGQGEHGLH